MKITDTIAGQITKAILADAKRCGIEPWAIGLTKLVRDAIIEWEKLKAKQPGGEL
jgi:hypothetical protein